MGNRSEILAKIDQLARRQHGYVTRGQLLDAGLGRRSLGDWTEAQRLIRVHTGVYAVGHISHHPIARTMAAVLACGHGAAASHESAGALWGPMSFPSMPEVSAPSRHRRPGITTHQTYTLTPALIRYQHGVPVTSVPRTILDLAPRLSDEELVRLIDDARDRSILGPNDLAELVASHHRIERLIDPRYQPTKSKFEQRFLALCRRHHLPTPDTNVRILPGIIADVLFSRERVIVELDSWRFHRSHEKFISDRARDRRTTALGFVTLRYPWEAVTPTGEAATAGEVRTILRERQRQRQRLNQNGG